MDSIEDFTGADETPQHQPGSRRVFVRGLELVGSIGIYEHERRYEQRVVVSLDLLVRDTYDGHSEQIGDVYDYDKAIAAVKSTIAARHYNLIETVAERIAEACLSDPMILVARVRIEKPDVLPACRGIGIEIVRAR